MGPTVITLAHTRAWVVRLPEPAQDVDKGDLGGIVHNAHGVTGLAGARLLVRRVGGEARAVTDCSRVDPIAGNCEGRAHCTSTEVMDAGGRDEIGMDSMN